MFERLSMRKHIGCESIYLLRSLQRESSQYVLLNRINSTCMLFLSMYTFIVLMMRSSCRGDDIHTNTCNQVTYVLMLYQLLNWKHITHNYILLYLLQQIHLCNWAVMNVLKIEQYGNNINLYSDSNDDMSNSHHTGLSQFNIRISKKIQFRSRIDPGSRIWSNK